MVLLVLSKPPAGLAVHFAIGTSFSFDTDSSADLREGKEG
jgi:hypothetical protein